MLFKETNLYHNFLRDGFVVINLFNQEELKKCLELSEKHSLNNMQGLLPSLRFGNASENLNLHKSIAAIAANALDRHFENYDFIANHLITKTANDINEFRLHQDWNVVNEQKNIAAHIWCALQTTNKDNGGLFVVKGSHLFYNNFRSGSLGLPVINTSDKVKKHLLSFKLNPGEAVVYNQRLFHGSHPNTSSSNRQVVLMSIKPKNVPMMYYQKVNSLPNAIGIKSYQINTEILFEQISSLEKGMPPEGGIPNESIIYAGLENNEISNSSFELHLDRDPNIQNEEYAV